MTHILSAAAALFASIQDGFQRLRVRPGLDAFDLSGTTVMWLVLAFVTWAVWLSLRRSYTRHRP
jgi:hypothetical protein